MKMNSRLFALAESLVSLGAFALLGYAPAALAGSPQVSVSNIPMTLVQPTPPQVMLAITNSESMDGNLSGAIMTGSGSISGFSGPSSPTCYSVPSGFTPPEAAAGTGGCPTGDAPYTYTDSSGELYDNSPSRLNVAKQSLMAVIKQYAPTFNMGLMDYKTGSPTRYITWVYYMSPAGGFAFTDNNADPLPTGATEWVMNPCYNASDSTDCSKIASVTGLSNVTSDKYMAVLATSDAPSINDVLYAGGLHDIFVAYGGPTPSSPYPPNFSLSSYNNGQIALYYNYLTPGSGSFGSSPTNAGYVPYSPQVLNSVRGFGYGASVKSTTGNVLVQIQPAGINGNPPTTSQINKYINQFVPYLAPETNKAASSEIKASAGQSPIAGLLAGAYSYFTNPGPPSANGCPAKRYMVVVTDGLPTLDMNGKNWPPLGSSAANHYGVYATFNLIGGGTVSTQDSSFSADVLAGKTLGLAINGGGYETNDQALIDTIKQLKNLAGSSVKTYIVGVGAGVDPNKNPAAAATLKAMAIAGDTSNYFAGSSPLAVVNDLSVIFGQIQAANMSTSSVAVNSGSVQNNTLVFQARFTSRTNPYNDWTGNLLAFPVGSNVSINTKSSNAVWQAATTLQSALSGSKWQNFPIYTWSGGSDAGASFTWSNLGSVQQAALEQYWATLSTAQQTSFNDSQAAYGQAIVDYLRGDQSQEQVKGGPFRDRSLLLGDIVDSNPLYIGAPSTTPGLYAPQGSSTSTQAYYTKADTAYNSFLASTANRAPVVYAGANNGMLYGFNANNGAPEFSFVPAGVYGDLANLSQPAYNASHRFYVDGSPNAGDVPFYSNDTFTWHTILTGGLRAGGAGIYALDVTLPGSFSASNVLWDITSQTPGFSQLGLTFAQPQIGVMNINNANGTPIPTPVVVFGNGYNSASSLPYLYVVNAQTGALIHAFDLCSSNSGIEPTACSSNAPDGLSTPTLLSTGGNGVADRAYAGDLQGNLWRFDMSSPDPANWTAWVMFKALGPSGNAQPITTAPTVSYAPYGTNGFLVFFGTGELLGSPDLTDTNPQSFYGVLDTGVNSTLTTNGGNPGWLTRGDLVQQTLTQTTYTGTNSTGGAVSVPVRTVSTNTVNYGSTNGWYMDLPLTGERVITSPSVFDQEVVFTTNIPSSNVCGGGISSWLMAVNFATGSAFSAPMLDLNGDSLINSSDQVPGTEETGPQNPVGVSEGSVYSSAPVVVPSGSQSVKLISKSNSQITTQHERAGLHSGRQTWVELR